MLIVVRHLLYAMLMVIVVPAAKGSGSVIGGNNAFGFNLMNTLHQDTSTNFWISPFSITSCFSLIYPGSSGWTQSQIANTMHYPTDLEKTEVAKKFLDLHSSIESQYAAPNPPNEVSTEDAEDTATVQFIDPSMKRSNPSPVVHIANKIYSAKSLVLKQSFVDSLNVKDTSFIEQGFNFKSPDATKRINQWVSTETDGLIDGIISENMDISDWRLVILNAIYLKGSWQKQFKSYNTERKPFYSDISRVNVIGECDLMSQTDDFPYYEYKDYQFVKVQFNDDFSGNLFTLFVLPRNGEIENERNGLITDQNVINEAITKMRSIKVILELPKVSVEATFALKEPLMKMGITNAFNAELADFSGISDESLMIDAVIHKTMLEMDENGLKAAAVTMIGLKAMAMPLMDPPQPVIFRADHPYQLFIIDGAHENTILFMGQINNPDLGGTGQPHKEVGRQHDSIGSVEVDLDGKVRNL